MPENVPTPAKKSRESHAAKRLTAGEEIATKPPKGSDMAFLHTTLCQVGLPRSKVAGRVYERQSGADSLRIEAGSLYIGGKWVEQPLPYGPMPRLALAFISTYAKRHKTRDVPIGESAYEFLRLIGLDNAGKRYDALRKQIHALAACHMMIGRSEGGVSKTFKTDIAKEFSVWVGDEIQRGIWPGQFTLDQRYFDVLMKNGVPLDQRALMALSGSALALDVYCWMAHRLHRIEGRPLLLRWASLREQFGQDYHGPEADKNFKKVFLPALEKVLEVYPQAKVKRAPGTGGGLMFFPSAPPIQKS